MKYNVLTWGMMFGMIGAIIIVAYEGHDRREAHAHAHALACAKRLHECYGEGTSHCEGSVVCVQNYDKHCDQSYGACLTPDSAEAPGLVEGVTTAVE